MIFHGIAVKPGKPTAFAIVDGMPFFGMPGNPTSCLSNAYILLVPFLRATARLPLYAPRTVRAPLGTRIVSPAGRHQFYTVRLRDGVAYPGVQGIRRDHEPVAGRRVHRDSRGSEHGRGGTS